MFNGCYELFFFEEIFHQFHSYSVKKHKIKIQVDEILPNLIEIISITAIKGKINNEDFINRCFW
jgi:hypothetical protein